MKPSEFEKNLRSAIEACNITYLHDVIKEGKEPLHDSYKNTKIKMFLYQLCQNDTEWFILNSILQGFTFREIGKLLDITLSGVSYHINKIKKRVKKTGVCLRDVV